MVKPEWGKKRTCPKCNTRFYDLQKNPVVCVDCGHEWVPEPILKSKQPIEVEAKAEKPTKAKKAETDKDTVDKEEDIDIESDTEDSDDDVLADVDIDDSDDDVSSVIDTDVDDKDES